MTIELALDLADFGFKVFPVNHGKDNTKKPLTKNGHLDATDDPNIIMGWWEKWPSAKVGVPTGINGLNVCDVDTKNGKDGWDSIDSEFLSLPETFAYDTSTGGRHLVYAAPKGILLNGQSDYRKLSGVDRRAGSSWVMWAGPAPKSRDEFAPAPDWMNDPAEDKRKFNFDGDLENWFESLVPGEPNALVRRAIGKINPDMSHSDMVEAQHSAIRLGAEGNSGVPVLLEKLREAWEARPSENHTTPEGEWGYKFEEALASGLEKFGDLTDLVKNLPDYNFGTVPTSIPDALVTGPPSGKEGFSKLLGALVREMDNDDRVVSILWNCPATTETARDWGLEFVYRRVQEARIRPEPTRENPRIEEERERESSKEVENANSLSLLSEEEREIVKANPTFVDHVEDAAREMGYDQLPYFRSTAWVTAAMAFSFKGFIPMTATHKMGLNLWFINLGESGTGKSVTSYFRDGILKVVFAGDQAPIPHDLGDDSSPQGLHVALLERDRLASLFSSDEAAGFFSTLGLRDWKTGIDEKITSWYNGYVAAMNKMTLKELRGKSALTSFNMHMFGTPDKVTRVVSSEMFETGFMARVNWVFGNPPRKDSSRFNLSIFDGPVPENPDEIPKVVKDLAIDLMTSVAHFEHPVPLTPAEGVMARLSEAYERMHRLAEKRDRFDLTEPSITRLSETMLKAAGICAMYRSDSVIRMEDALNAIAAVEEWFGNLFQVVEMISAGDFQRDCNTIEIWIRARKGKTTKAALYHAFGNMIVRDPRELDMRINYLVESGILNREETANGVKYELNGA